MLNKGLHLFSTDENTNSGQTNKVLAIIEYTSYLPHCMSLTNNQSNYSSLEINISSGSCMYVCVHIASTLEINIMAGISLDDIPVIN